ncbi:MAG: hypothetical protein ACLRXC_13960 [[Clostridium] leptum]
MLIQGITSRTPIDKGWSCDKKFCAVAADGTRYLLRITPKEKSGSLAKLFVMLRQVAELGIPMCRLVESGPCGEGVYSLYTWIDTDASRYLIARNPNTKRAFRLGESYIKSTPFPRRHQEPWYTRFSRKADRKIAGYREAGIRFPKGWLLNILWPTDSTTAL